MTVNLYQLVKEYAALGDHRTGTAVDRQTVEWLSARISELGGAVELHPFLFPMFSSHVEISDERGQVAADALAYSAVSRVVTRDPWLGELQLNAGHPESAPEDVYAAAIRAARDEGKSVVVLATRGGNEGLTALNRSPREPGDMPVCLVAGRDLERLRTGAPNVHFDASIAPGEAMTVCGRFGNWQSSKPPLIITTPISGWFRCAGERGTGIALALSVAREIAESVPVLLVVPSGHELGYLGARHFAADYHGRPRAVLHLGSCMAALGAIPVSRQAGAIGNFIAVSHLPEPVGSAVAVLLKEIGVTPDVPPEPLNPCHWVGESEIWAPRGWPMLSMAGDTPTFHTPQDVVETATSPELIERVERVVKAVAGQLAALD